MQPQKNKITEKQFLRALVASVCSILLCLTGLVGTTWAWHTLTISSEDNTIRVGAFGVDVAVTSNNGGTANPTSGELTYDLPAGEYTVRISCSGENTIPGYCVVKLADQVFETIRLNPLNSGAEKPSTIEFAVKVAEPSKKTDSEGEGTGEQQTRGIYTARLQIVPMWGDPAGISELVGEALSEITNGVVSTSDPESAPSTPDESTPNESTPNESTPTESTPNESTPNESTPNESTPNESTPNESTPNESTPDESTPDDSGTQPSGDEEATETKETENTSED